jgi:cell division protein FtsN
VNTQIFSFYSNSILNYQVRVGPYSTQANAVVAQSRLVKAPYNCQGASVIYTDK